MPGQSPLSMMRAERPQPAPPERKTGRRRRLWPIAAPVVILILAALGWCGMWYFGAAVAGRTLTGWMQREAASGRYYSCGSQSIGGFPFRIEVHCSDAAGELKNNQPPFSIQAKNITFVAQVYHPTLLVGDFTPPLSLADVGQPPKYVANWSLAQLRIRGVPPDPDSIAATLRQPQLDQVDGGKRDLVFQADQAEVHVRIIAGSANDNPVIETMVQVHAAKAPKLHPILADPIEGEFDSVLRGFSDLRPTPWPERLRQLEAAGGSIEIKYLRLERPDSIVVGNGTLKVNEHGKLDGVITIAVVGIEHIVPLLGLDKLIGQGIDRLTGLSGQPAQGLGAQGLGALDRLLPGLGGAIRQSANASLIETIKKMGQPTQIDGKPAIALPLRVSDGMVSLGMIPIGQLPSLL